MSTPYVQGQIRNCRHSAGNCDINSVEYIGLIFNANKYKIYKRQNKSDLAESKQNVRRYLYVDLKENTHDSLQRNCNILSSYILASHIYILYILPTIAQDI